ncbi:hypothetical protein GGF43_006972, partial [Coemansia sp. RSA 2618]
AADQTPSNSDGILGNAGSLAAAKDGGWSEGLTDSAAAEGIRQSPSSNGSDATVSQDNQSTDELFFRKKAALADKLLESIRYMHTELLQAVNANESMSRKAFRLLHRQTYQDTSTDDASFSTQPAASSPFGSGSNGRLLHSLEKLKAAAQHNGDRVGRIANVAEQVLDEADAAL